jgi:L-asparaginase
MLVRVTPRRRVRLLALGGTIACAPRPGADGVDAALSAAAIAESVPGLAEIADLEVGDMATVASFAVTFDHMHAVALEAARALGEGAGVVVTHGTDTIEETAYALALMVPRAGPLVLTGAMRNPTVPGADGPANLLAACLVAADPASARLGPVVVLNDELHAARFATKSHTARLSTIASPGAGPLGEVVEGRLHTWFLPAWEDFLGLPDSLAGIDVPLVRMAADPEERLLSAAIESAPAAVVIEGTGGGHVPPPLLPTLDGALATGIPVVLATRCAAGRNLESTYGMPGGEVDLIRRGVLPAGFLSGHKARLRLVVGLALGRSPHELFPV